MARPVILEDIYTALKYIINLLSRPMNLEPGTGRQRVTVDGGTLPTVTTCSTVTTLNQLYGFSTKDTLLNHQKRQAWAACVRSRL